MNTIKVPKLVFKIEEVDFLSIKNKWAKEQSAPESKTPVVTKVPKIVSKKEQSRNIKAQDARVADYTAHENSVEGLRKIEKRIIFLTGKKCSKETRSKISNSLMGRPLSENHKKKISEAKKGTFTGNSNPNYGNRHTAEAIKKMSEVRKQYWSNKNKGSSNG